MTLNRKYFALYCLKFIFEWPVIVLRIVYSGAFPFLVPQDWANPEIQ